jgi:hypothetical protein
MKRIKKNIAVNKKRTMDDKAVESPNESSLSPSSERTLETGVTGARLTVASAAAQSPAQSARMPTSSASVDLSLVEAKQKIKDLQTQVVKAWDSHKAAEQLYKLAATRADASERSFGDIASEVQGLRKQLETEKQETQKLRGEAQQSSRGLGADTAHRKKGATSVLCKIDTSCPMFLSRPFA